MLTPDELHNILIGKVELRLTDGTTITLSPTSFNDGGQHLNVDVS